MLASVESVETGPWKCAVRFLSSNNELYRFQVYKNYSYGC